MPSRMRNTRTAEEDDGGNDTNAETYTATRGVRRYEKNEGFLIRTLLQLNLPLCNVWVVKVQVRSCPVNTRARDTYNSGHTRISLVIEILFFFKFFHLLSVRQHSHCEQTFLKMLYDADAETKQDQTDFSA